MAKTQLTNKTTSKSSTNRTGSGSRNTKGNTSSLQTETSVGSDEGKSVTINEKLGGGSRSENSIEYANIGCKISFAIKIRGRVPH